MRRFLAVLAMLCPFLGMGQLITIKGKIINEQMEPIIGATITVKGSGKAATSNNRGEFTLTERKLLDTLIVSSVGYETREVPNNEGGSLTVILQRKVGMLDEAVVIAYGTTTRRLNTGSVSKVTADEIGRQPVSNPLAALQGRVPGLTVSQSNGVPGSSFKVQLRGRSSIAQGSDPLFVIDGVPYVPNNDNTNQLSSVAAFYSGDGLSPFHSINPADIESIEVLKDADATAIYGSRGANGVILVTTKKGRAGKAEINISLSSGFSRVTRSTPMLSTAEYIKMRRQAFANDNVTPTITNAPDLVAWDTTRYTDFQKELTGGTAHTSEARLTFSGGSNSTRFLIGTGYHRQTTVFPGSMASDRMSVHLNLNHQAPGTPWMINLSAQYSGAANNLVSPNLASAIALPPNAPPLYDSAGNWNWQEGGAPFNNPLAALDRTYKARTDNLVSNLLISYRFSQKLSVKTSLGYQTYLMNEESLLPKRSANPLSATNPTGASSFGSNRFKSYMAEPRLEYITFISKGKVTALLGGSWQQTVNDRWTTSATGYTNDALLRYINAATTVTVNNNYNEYRYQALFGRLQYNWRNKYLLNLSARRDGSSRFGPGRQFATFGAAGAAWIFSEEPLIKETLSWLSYGKLRTSYGSSGSDQIGDYQYIDTWSASQYPYGGAPGFNPTRLFNPDYGWERNRKLEAAIDLGLFKDHLLLSAAWFRNRSSNQLLRYQLPALTGFTSINRNLPALVENTGWELELNARLLSANSLKWNMGANLTLPRNKLVAFPGLEVSSYANTYVVGQPLNLLYGYRFMGVDPETGIYSFEDVNKDNALNANDLQVLGSLDPVLYGGLSNTFSCRSLQLDVFLEFRKGIGPNYLASMLYTPGTANNLPASMLNYWQVAGDDAEVQRPTATSNTPAYKAYSNMALSDAIYSDASYVRLKNLALSFVLPGSWLKRARLENGRFFLQGQNLLTVTRYKGADPETAHLFKLPPLRTLVGGLQFTF